MAKNDEFFAAYDRWEQDCLQEYNEKFGENRTLIESDDYEPGDVVEFSEDGSAYPHGRGGTNHIPNAVTPWKDSPHFME